MFARFEDDRALDLVAAKKERFGGFKHDDSTTEEILSDSHCEYSVRSTLMSPYRF